MQTTGKWLSVKQNGFKFYLNDCNMAHHNIVAEKWKIKLRQLKTIPFLYLAVSTVWIYATDRIVYLYSTSSESAHWMQTYKGWLFVIASTCILYFIIKLHIKSLNAFHETVINLACRDQLTNTVTRKIFVDRISKLFSLSKRGHNCFGLIFIDIDGFKQINDTYGHLIGDKVLIYTADTLKSILRNSDTVSRFGGDEFLILTPEIRCQGALDHIKMKLDAAFELPFRIDEEREIKIAISIGTSLFPDNGSTLDELIRVADEDMYRTKNSEKSRTVCCAEGIVIPPEA